MATDMTSRNPNVQDMMHTWVCQCDFLTDRKSSILGFWQAPGGQETFQKGEGGFAPATFLEGFPAARGRPDHQNRRFPVGQKIID